MKRLCRYAAGLAMLLAVGAIHAQQKEPVNRVPNGDLENGVVQPFVSYGAVTMRMAKRADAHTGSEALNFVVGAKGANFWDSGVQFNQNIRFDKNVKYTWAFFMKADKNIEINIKPELGVDPWTAYGEKRGQVTTDYKEFTTTWTAGVDVVPASLTLHVAFDVAEFWMDDVRWYEGDYVPFGGGPQAVEPSGKAATTWANLKAR